MTTLHEVLTGQAKPDTQPVTCAFVSTRGRACLREVVEGDTLCVLHGASVVRAREVVQRKLLALQEKAVETLAELFLMADDKVRLAAATVVLDRTGLGPKSTVEIGTGDAALGLTPSELHARLAQAQAKVDELARLTLDAAPMPERSH